MISPPRSSACSGCCGASKAAVFDLRYTKIIATLGPASADVEVIKRLIRAGADGLRVNFSHGDGASMQPLMDAARTAARAEGRHVALLADIQGPKLRIGKLPREGVLLLEGAP